MRESKTRDVAVKRPFADLYSQYYDMIYSDKNYGVECDYVERLFKKYASSPTKSILDVGAGTGGYAIVLAKRGYSVLATDISKYMLEIAKRKAKEQSLNTIKFKVADMGELRLNKTFDACVCMFAAIDYVGSLAKIRDVCSNVARHLRPGGLFIFDFWNGSAVLRIRPSSRHKVVESGDTLLIRLSEPTLDVEENRISVRFRTFVLSRKVLKHEFTEQHEMTYLFRSQVVQVLKESGFRLLSIHPFLRPDDIVSDGDWSVTVVASKK